MCCVCVCMSVCLLSSSLSPISLLLSSILLSSLFLPPILSPCLPPLFFCLPYLSVFVIVSVSPECVKVTSSEWSADEIGLVFFLFLFAFLLAKALARSNPLSVNHPRVFMHRGTQSPYLTPLPWKRGRHVVMVICTEALVCFWLAVHREGDENLLHFLELTDQWSRGTGS